MEHQLGNVTVGELIKFLETLPQDSRVAIFDLTHDVRDYDITVEVSGDAVVELY